MSLRRRVLSAPLSAGTILGDQTGYCTLIQHICRSALEKTTDKSLFTANNGNLNTVFLHLNKNLFFMFLNFSTLYVTILYMKVATIKYFFTNDCFKKFWCSKGKIEKKEGGGWVMPNKKNNFTSHWSFQSPQWTPKEDSTSWFKPTYRQQGEKNERIYLEKLLVYKEMPDPWTHRSQSLSTSLCHCYFITVIHLDYICI